MAVPADQRTYAYSPSNSVVLRGAAFQALLFLLVACGSVKVIRFVAVKLIHEHPCLLAIARDLDSTSKKRWPDHETGSLANPGRFIRAIYA